MITLRSLHVYPVKGCAGIDVESAGLAAEGLRYGGAGDREWMVVDAATGRFETQRTLPAMATLRTQVDGEALVLAMTGRRSLRVPLALPAAPARREVTVWRHDGPALDEGDAAANWISDALGRRLRIVRFDRSHPRFADAQWTGPVRVPTFFADGYPLLAIGAASLALLDERLAASGRVPVPMDRFRPNLVLDGLDAHDEDHLEAFGDDSVELRPVKPCTRCTVPSIDQSTGIAGDDPVQVLAAYRRDDRVGGITFGVNVIVVRGAGTTLRAGRTFEPRWSF